MNRVMIIGAPGSGKSTLAQVVGAQLSLPVVHFDQVFWMPGWVERPKDAQMVLARQIEEQDIWVCEGNFSRTWATRTERADLVVWLDLPLPLRFWRILKRWARWRGIRRPDMAEGCPERLDPEFLGYVLTAGRAFRGKAAAMMAGLPVGKGLHLRSRRAIAAWVGSL